MTTTSIVQQLADWAKQVSAKLAECGVQLTKKFPEPGSMHPWKASVALAYDGVIVSYTVWEQSRLQTELLVMNTLTGKTVVMEEGEPTNPSAVSTELDSAIRNLLDGSYRRMNPDPKLTIS
jgi:hypothetical protein